MVNNFGAQLLEGVFPNYCALCGMRSYRAVPLCRECEHEMPLNLHYCKRCAIPLPLATDQPDDRICGACLDTQPPYHRVIAPWLYDDYLAHLIHLWKYQREQRMTAVLASLWRQHVTLDGAIDVLVPVPLHWQRRWHRGFNQSELLARQLIATCPQLAHCRLAPRLVKRRRATAAQSGMNARQRGLNLAGAFTVYGRCDNLRIAIVDDVLTTGATAATMASELAYAGAQYIEVWCLARTPAPGD